MTTTRYYRIHDTGIVTGCPVEDLLDPDYQVSRVWIGEVDGVSEQAGVSVCRSVDDLRRYFAGRAGYIRDGVVLVELEGELCDEDDIDAEHGALLVRPTRIVGVYSIDTGAADVAAALDGEIVDADEDLEWINSWAETR